MLAEYARARWWLRARMATSTARPTNSSPTAYTSGDPSPGSIAAGLIVGGRGRASAFDYPGARAATRPRSVGHAVRVGEADVQVVVVVRPSHHDAGGAAQVEARPDQHERGAARHEAVD